MTWGFSRVLALIGLVTGLFQLGLAALDDSRSGVLEGVATLFAFIIGGMLVGLVVDVAFHLRHLRRRATSGGPKPRRKR